MEVRLCERCAAASIEAEQTMHRRATTKLHWRAPIASVIDVITSVQQVPKEELFFTALEFQRSKGEVQKEEAAQLACSGRSIDKKVDEAPVSFFAHVDIANLVRERVDSDDW
mmetsp:Transcript_43790/g.128981  ORF Transcript_43790/g.128981 Transcript_43790/m.128981 type:complete len:112 (-) Transcript_43790:287-622(-)